ncbi:MAG TPA: holo-ACP synthase, partial [Chromatiales bacterium]|nr:holo-ACP synthase [Chromatiales bacterium]
FAARILTEQELAEYRQAVHPAHFLAKRFAAKEATAKAMGTGFRNGLSLRNIAVGHDEHGKPLLILTGEAQALACRHGIRESHLSLADENEYAVAFVTLVNGRAG